MVSVSVCQICTKVQSIVRETALDLTTRQTKYTGDTVCPKHVCKWAITTYYPHHILVRTAFLNDWHTYTHIYRVRHGYLICICYSYVHFHVVVTVVHVAQECVDYANEPTWEKAAQSNNRRPEHIPVELNRAASASHHVPVSWVSLSVDRKNTCCTDWQVDLSMWFSLDIYLYRCEWSFWVWSEKAEYEQISLNIRDTNNSDLSHCALPLIAIVSSVVVVHSRCGVRRTMMWVLVGHLHSCWPQFLVVLLTVENWAAIQWTLLKKPYPTIILAVTMQVLKRPVSNNKSFLSSL